MKICIASFLALTLACVVTTTKEEVILYDQQGRPCGTRCTERTEITTPDGVTAGGSINILGASIGFQVGDKKSECTPKTPQAMDNAKAALEPCKCKKGTDGDAPLDTEEDVDAVEVEEGGGDDGGEGGECVEGASQKTECTYTLTEAEWDCKEV